MAKDVRLHATLNDAPPGYLQPMSGQRLRGDSLTQPTGRPAETHSTIAVIHVALRSRTFLVARIR
jgi:hypothetical protein